MSSNALRSSSDDGFNFRSTIAGLVENGGKGFCKTVCRSVVVWQKALGDKPYLDNCHRLDLTSKPS
jgi:hypothetical protein